MAGLGFALAFLSIPSVSLAMTLDEAYSQATRVRAEIQTRRLDREIARAQKREAVAGVLPTGEISSQSRWLDQITLAGDTGRFSQAFQHTARITLSQPIFQGGSEYFGLSLASGRIDLAGYEELQARRDLYRQVAQQYIDLLLFDEDIRRLSDQIELLQQRVGALNKRVRIGRSKISDLVAARSQLARTEADLALARSDRKAAERRFAWLTGIESADSLTEPFAQASFEVDPAWEQGVLETPEFLARQAEVSNAQKSLRVIQGDYFPDVEIGGNIYLDRAGILSGSDWDMTLLARWEFFSGGATRSQAQAQTLEMQKLEIELTDLKRLRMAEYEGLVEQLALRRETLAKLEVANEWAEKSFQEQQKEYDRGLITNLDVIRSLDEKLLVRSALDRERSRVKLAWIELKVLVGHLPR